MYRHHPAPVLANPFCGRHPHAMGLPWWGGALLAFAVIAPPLAGGQPEPRINFPNSLAPVPRGARVVTGVRPIADTEPVAQARSALDVQFERVVVVGEQFIVPASVPSLPASVGRAVLGINGLQHFLHFNKGPLAVPLNKKSADR